MQSQTLWDHIDVGLPELPYDLHNLAANGKGSTMWASHSHTPVSISEWGAFDACILVEAAKQENAEILDADVVAALNTIELHAVHREEDVTNNTMTLLRPLSDLSTFEFTTSDEFTMSNPDLVALKKVERTMGGFSQYASPPSRTTARDEQRAKMTGAVLFCFETKPAWKFRFLVDAENSTQLMIDSWEVPPDFTPKDMSDKVPLPHDWSMEKKKVFHLIRQVYGQMTSSKLKYGIIHVYEVWWFCCRDAEGGLKISHPFKKTDTSPSVFQAIKTLAGFDDYGLAESSHHPSSALKVQNNTPKALGRVKKRNYIGRSGPGQEGNRKPLPGQGGNRKPPASPRPDGNKERSSTALAADLGGLASEIYLWDCELVDTTDNVKLLSSNKYPFALIKMQRNSRERHVADEMEREAAIYSELMENTDVKKAIAVFHGFSTHLGVPILCLGLEGPDFEDIGVENLPHELKVSAVESLQLLSQAGLLHHDLALRNIVQSKENPKQAKIIDFGRAEFTEDRHLLQKQVEFLKSILEIGEYSRSEALPSVDEK
jgi:hypothetical protein